MHDPWEQTAGGRDPERRSAEPPIITVSPASEERLEEAAKQLASFLHPTTVSKSVLLSTATGLCTLLADTIDVSGTVFLSRGQLYERRAFETFVLWATPVVIKQDAQKIDALTESHAELLKPFQRDLDALLHIVDPRTSPSLGHLRHQLCENYPPSRMTKVLPVAFER